MGCQPQESLEGAFLFFGGAKTAPGAQSGPKMSPKTAPRKPIFSALKKRQPAAPGGREIMRGCAGVCLGAACGGQNGGGSGHGLSKSSWGAGRLPPIAGESF